MQKAQVAMIREEECVGCTKCIPACPVDAIIGSEKHLHAVLVHECIGCGLCVEPCPVDCITMVEQQGPLIKPFDPVLAQRRHKAKKQRQREDEQAKLAQQTQHRVDLATKQHYILQALQRVKGGEA